MMCTTKVVENLLFIKCIFLFSIVITNLWYTCTYIAHSHSTWHSENAIQGCAELDPVSGWTANGTDACTTPEVLAKNGTGWALIHYCCQKILIVVVWKYSVSEIHVLFCDVLSPLSLPPPLSLLPPLPPLLSPSSSLSFPSLSLPPLSLSSLLITRWILCLRIVLKFKSSVKLNSLQLW